MFYIVVVFILFVLLIHLGLNYMILEVIIVSDMIEKLYSIANECIEEMQQNERMVMTTQDKRRHYTDNICHVCNT